MTATEQRRSGSVEFREIVKQWPIERIQALEARCALPKTRIAALLSVGVSAFGSLCSGRYTPSPALCRRMEQLEQMADLGELHGEYVPEKSDLQRRLTLFRAWFFEKPPTADFPLVTVAIKIRWSKCKYNEVTLPIESLPALRLTRWNGLVEVVKAVSAAVRGLARGNARLMWKSVDAEFWNRYATETLPAIVEARARKIGEKRNGV